MAGRSEADEAAMQRRIRHNIFASGAYPYGEKQLNPKRKETAHEYSEWTKTQASHSINDGAYRDMLEAEERHLGTTSYPPGHPRREEAIRGYPSVSETAANRPAKPVKEPLEAGTGFSGL
jgi:hypothetical protein